MLHQMISVVCPHQTSREAATNQEKPGEGTTDGPTTPRPEETEEEEEERNGSFEGQDRDTNIISDDNTSSYATS